MKIENDGIGGIEVKNETFADVANIPTNKILITEKLTANTPAGPEIVLGLTNVEMVFGHFKPTIEIQLEKESGALQKETLRFTNMGDFSINGIVSQSDFLRKISLQKEQNQKMTRQLRMNKLLRQILSDQTSKQSMLTAVTALIRQLEEA